MSLDNGLKDRRLIPSLLTFWRAVESFKWAFNACRVPASPSDYAVKVSEDSPEAQHLVVVRRNNFYSIPLQDKQGRQFTIQEFKR